jgi:hypothetical protein
MTKTVTGQELSELIGILRSWRRLATTGHQEPSIEYTASLCESAATELERRASLAEPACEHPVIPPSDEKVCRDYPNCGCGRALNRREEHGG